MTYQILSRNIVCFSWITIYIANDAAEHLIDSWNRHRVPGRNGCVPIDNMRNTKRTTDLLEPFIPTVPEADFRGIFLLVMIR